jgi:hypothetical protein
VTDRDKSLPSELKGHAEIMKRDRGKFVRFIDAAACLEAADRIEALSAENARLRETMKKKRDAHVKAQIARILSFMPDAEGRN